MRRADEIAKLEETATSVESAIFKRKKLIDEDPLCVHPAEVKQRVDELESVKQSLRPSPIVLHLDGLRVKVPYDQCKEMLGDIDIFGRKLRDLTTITPSRLGGSTMVRILTMAQLQTRERFQSKT
jgi:methyl coenzyme M reductase subunit C-like uncharacterized protein (methanogenesis marker protein 7)